MKRFILTTMLLAFAASLALAASFFAANKAWTGEWNYQGGARKTFVYQFPLEHKDVTFDNAPGRPMSSG